jgi:hypothetical protein
MGRDVRGRAAQAPQSLVGSTPPGILTSHVLRLLVSDGPTAIHRKRGGATQRGLVDLHFGDLAGEEMRYRLKAVPEQAETKVIEMSASSPRGKITPERSREATMRNVTCQHVRAPGATKGDRRFNW